MLFSKPLIPRHATQVFFQPQIDCNSPKQGVVRRLLRKSKAVLSGQLSLVFVDTHELKTIRQSTTTENSLDYDLQALNDGKMVLPKVASAEQNRRLTRTDKCLSVVRERDINLSAMCAGRMTISGRFADVCAELDRLERLGQHVSG